VSETSPKALVMVKRTGDPVGTVTVDYLDTGAGTAKAGTDYTFTPGMLTFLPNQTIQTISIPILHDPAVDGTETIVLQLANAQWLNVGPAAAGPLATTTVNILDRGPTVQFSAAAYSVSEASKTFSITVRRLGSLAGAASVTYDVTGGTATRDVDYSVVAPGALTFAAGQSLKTITVTLPSDTVVDGNKTVDLALSRPSPGIGLGTPSTTELTITEKDVAGSAQFSVSDFSVGESDGFATITVTRTGGTASNATVAYATADLDPATTATAGSDYTSTSGTLTFGPNVTVQSFPIPILDDGLVNPGVKTIVLTLGPTGGGLSLGSRPKGTLWIVKE